MKPVYRLLFRFTLFSLPMALVLAFPFYVMARAGEFVSARRIMELQERNGRPYLIGPAYSDYWGYIKYQSAQNRGASVLVLGSSRVMQFRQDHFRVSFYNGAKGIAELAHFRAFLTALPEKARPKILIAGLDPNLLNPGWVWSSSTPIYEAPSTGKEWLIILGKKWTQLYLDLARGAFGLGVIREKNSGLEKLGLIARAKERGFLNDGSFFYGDFSRRRLDGIREPSKKRFSEDLENIRTGADVYVPAASLSKEGLKELERFLAEAKRLGVHVAGYVPPYAPSVYARLQARRQEFLFLHRFRKTLAPLFKKYGSRFYDFKNPAGLSATDDEFVDGQHDGGDVTVRILKAMAKKDPLLKATLSPAQRRLAQL